MKIIGFAKPGQVRCFNCGEPFVLGSLVAKDGADTNCPNNNTTCNNGSWIRWEADSYYSVPVEIDADKVRRQIEDRIRKDKNFFLKVAALNNSYNK